MSVRPLIPFAFLLAIAACSHPTSPTPPGGQGASTYYVSTAGNDLSAGTLEQPFRTIKKGLSHLRPGDTLYIRGGAYDETILESSFGATGTSWSAFITVTGYPGETVILRPTSGPGNVARFTASGGIQYVLLKDITLDAITAGGGIGASVLHAEADNLHFDTVEVMNGDQTGITSFGSHNTFTNMHVHRNGASTDPNSAAEGVYNTGSYNSFIGGEYDNNECNAIRIWNSAHDGRFGPVLKSHDNLVSGITIHDNGKGHAQLRSGLSRCRTGGGAFSVGDYNNTVIDNVVYNGYWGWDDTFAQAPGETGGNRVENNTIYNVDYCCNLFSSHTTFQDNTIYQVANGAKIVNTGTGNTVENNHFTDLHP